MLSYVLWARQEKDFLAVWGFCFIKTGGPVLERGDSGNKVFGKLERRHLLPAAFIPSNSCLPHSIITTSVESSMGPWLLAWTWLTVDLWLSLQAVLQLVEVWCPSQSCRFCLCREPALAVDVFKPLRGVIKVGNISSVPPHLFLTTHGNVKYLSELVLGLSTDISSLFPEFRKKIQDLNLRVTDLVWLLMFSWFGTSGELA